MRSYVLLDMPDPVRSIEHVKQRCIRSRRRGRWFAQARRSWGGRPINERRRATELTVDPEIRRLELRSAAEEALQALEQGDATKARDRLRLAVHTDAADDAFLADDLTDRPLADEWHAEHVRQWMDEGLSPEEWVARNGSFLVADNSDTFRYEDPALDDWTHRTFAILGSLRLRELAQERYLTPEERERIEAEARQFAENF